MLRPLKTSTRSLSRVCIARAAGLSMRCASPVLPNLASYTLLRFEINVRASSIVGFVGAGGIGQDLFVAIRKFYYTDVSAILLMIILTVSIIDLVTERIRHRLAPVESIG